MPRKRQIGPAVEEESTDGQNGQNRMTTRKKLKDNAVVSESGQPKKPVVKKKAEKEKPKESESDGNSSEAEIGQEKKTKHGGDSATKRASGGAVSRNGSRKLDKVEKDSNIDEKRGDLSANKNGSRKKKPAPESTAKKKVNKESNNAKSIKSGTEKKLGLKRKIIVIDDEEPAVSPLKKSKIEPAKKSKSTPVVQPRGRSPSVSSSSDSEWEDVADDPTANDDLESSDVAGPSKSLQITVNAPKTQKQLDVEGELRRALKRFKKELQENLHKAHLLSFIACGRHLSSVCNDEMNQAVALSLVPVGYAGFGKDPKVGKDQLKRFVKWFCSGFNISGDDADNGSAQNDLILVVRDNLQSRVAFNQKTLALCFVTTMRSLGLDVRIVINAHPISKKMAGETNSPENAGKKSGNGSRAQAAKSATSKKETGEKKSATGKKKKMEENVNEKQSTSSATTPKSSKMEKSSKDVSKSRSSGVAEKRKSSKSSDDDVSDISVEKVQSTEYWAEVYLETIETWLCINCNDGTVDDVESMREILSGPVLYCLSFDKDLALKDVTSRYASDFMSTQTRRLRIQGEWLTKTFDLFRSTKRIRNRLEDLQLEAKLSKQSMPTTIGEFKNHPLYALKKDLKKFEAIYPADTKPLGYIRNEPIYPRSAVHMLHSKDTWRKDALSVRENEQPYKMVKGRPTWDAVNKQKVENREVAVYGIWQTEPYKAEAAKNGIVPRNEYGNVYLFKKSMLPPGTVHLQLPGLLHVAKKMDVDCAPAMTGWDYHCRGSHPVLDGWIVCEEFKDALVAAWEEEQALAEAQKIERRSKRALKNWHRLIKGLFIRQKLQRKFKSNFDNANANEAKADQDDEKMAKSRDKKKNETEESEAIAGTSKDYSSTRVRASWPQRHHEFTGNHEEEL